MQPRPRAALEVIKTEFFLELLMRPLADPARLDGTGNILDRRVCREIGEIVFSLAVGTMLAHQPGFFTRHMLCAGVADRFVKPSRDQHCLAPQLQIAPVASSPRLQRCRQEH